MAKELKELTKRSENYSQWYNGRPRRTIGCARLYGNKALWIRNMGKDAAAARRYV